MVDCCYIYDKAILLHLWVKLYYIYGGFLAIYGHLWLNVMVTFWPFMVKCYYIYDGHYIYASLI